jgi:hypothetical protein
MVNVIWIGRRREDGSRRMGYMLEMEMFSRRRI